MALKRSCASDRIGDVSGPNVKKKRSTGRSLLGVNIQSTDTFETTKEESQSGEIQEAGQLALETKDKTTAIASTPEVAGQTVAPFLARHIPNQYAPLGTHINNRLSPPRNPNSRYCYRHRPDLTCRRQADEPSMDKLQKDLDTLPHNDRQGITHLWSLFSAAPSKHRNLMLQGLLAQCCFPQLSYLAGSVRDLLKIDFLSALPPEISFKILCFLDTNSLCKAAQVSRRWRELADDDVVWHRMCEQHIDRKCTRCGWGLPAVEQKRLRATKRQIQLRAQGLGLNEWSPYLAPQTEDHLHPHGAHTPTDGLSSRDEVAHIPPLRASSPGHPTNAPSPTSENELPRKSILWKDIYKDRFKIGSNWKYGRCSIKSFRGHSNGVMCLQFMDNILATGSYDTKIKIWDIASGKEISTLAGHTQGVRCLQFDDNKLISGSLDKNLRLWNWKTGECLSTYRGHDGGVIGLHFAGDHLASGSVDNNVKIWNFRDKSITTLRGHTDWVNSVKLDMESRTIFSASDDLTVRLWDLDTKKCLRILRGHVGQVQQIIPLLRSFEIDEFELAKESEDNSDSGSNVSSSNGSSPRPEPVSEAVSNLPATEIFPSDPDRPLPPRFILTGALDSTIRLWEVTTGKCIKTFFGHVEGVWALAADSLRFVSGAEDRMVKVWDARSGACEKTYTGHAGPVTCIGLSSSRMCSGSEDGEVRLYSFKH